MTMYEKYKAKGKANIESSALSGIILYVFNINIELKAETIRIRYPQLALSRPRTTTRWCFPAISSDALSGNWLIQRIAVVNMPSGMPNRKASQLCMPVMANTVPIVIKGP